MLRVCAHYSSLFPEERRERLRELAASPWSEVTRDYVFAEMRSAAEVIVEFAARDVPLPLLVGMLRERAPRGYSVAHCDASSLQLLVSDVQAASPGGRVRVGQASSSLVSPGVERLRVRIVSGRLSNATIGDCALFVVAGTGLAAVTSLLRPPHFLFQGCRSAQLSAAFLAAFPNVFVALSRGPGPKTYVWELLLARSDEIYARFLAPGDATIVIAGSVSSGFARDTLSALQTVFRRHAPGEQTREQAESFLRAMETRGRLLLDVWG